MGWHAVHRVCSVLGIEIGVVNAKKNRHLFSTRYATIDVPAGHHRSTFYKHMGHSDSVNENIYQVLPAEAEILRVSAVLQQFDSVFLSFSYSYNYS